MRKRNSAPKVTVAPKPAPKPKVGKQQQGVVGRAAKSLAAKFDSKKNEDFIFRAVQTGVSKRDFPIQETPGPKELAVNVLAFASFIAQYCPEFTQAKANSLLGTLWDDARRAMLGQISLMEQAPQVWWEFRHALNPTTQGLYRYTWTDPGTTVAYPVATSFSFLGKQEPALVDIGSAVPASAYYSAIDSANANYDAFSKIIGHGAHALKLKADPFKGQSNTDASLYSFYLGTGSSDAFGGSIDASTDHADFNRFLEVPIKTRWLGGAGLRETTAVYDGFPTGAARLCSSGVTEIGHRMFCVANNAPMHIRDALPVVAPISAFALIDKTLKLFSAAVMAGGLVAGGLTSTNFPPGVQGFASYLYGCLFEWFAPWSCVAFCRSRANSVNTTYYRATAGCMVQGLWKGKPIPAALALNLSYLLPCFEPKSKRVFYPVLLMDCNPGTFAVADYPAFAALNVGTPSWINPTTSSFYQAYDNNGAVAQVLGTFANNCPMRVLPHAEHTFSLACHWVTQYIDNTHVATDYWMVLSPKKPEAFERDLYATFVLPQVYTIVPTRTPEWIRMLELPENTVVQQYGNRNSYFEYIATNGNMLSSTAKAMLEEYDYLQEIAVKKKSEEEGGFSSWVPSSGTLAVGIGSVAATAASMMIQGGMNVKKMLPYYQN